MLTRSTEILKELIAFRTISADSNIAMINYLEAHFDALGARCWISGENVDEKANLVATFGPDGPGGIMLSGHTDVVPVADQDWSTDPFVMEERDDCLFGRGTCDMKGFIAATMAMAETIQPDELTCPLHFIYTYDEETGCLGARHLIGELSDVGIVPDIAIIGEPTEMKIVEGHKGCFEYSAEFTGLEGHGSAPDDGVNAAEFAARYVARLLELREALIQRAPDWSRFVPPWTTLNVGRIDGGIAHNVIAGKAEVDWEMRPVQESDADFVKRSMEDYVTTALLPAMTSVSADAGVLVRTIAEVAGLEPKEHNAARDLVAELTGQNSTELVAFGTEAGIFHELGSNIVVCGPGSIAQAHKADEFLSLTQLSRCCKFLENLAVHVTK